MSQAAVSLDDKYALEQGRVFLTGIQALVRLPMVQRQRDAAQGLDTACFITGYRGSPLGGYDQQLHRARRFLERNQIHFQSGLNEDLAATAVWGTQQVGLHAGAKHDGVFSIWYGKGPGVDRSGDVFKHGNAAGTSPHGGVLLLIGDDHTCKSSTLPHQSELAMVDASIPVLNPAGVQDILDLGLHGWAMSRLSGCWVSLKAIAESMDSSASVTVDPQRALPVRPADFEMPSDGVSIRWPDDPLAQEYRLHRYKLYAALAYARANRLDGRVFGAERPRFGIVTTGKSYLDVRQALDDLHIDEAAAARLGLAIYKVGMSWPLERDGIRRFAEGLEEILVVEEKRALIENQLKEQLYNWRADVRPRVVGKFDEQGEWILPSPGELTPARIARVIAKRLEAFEVDAGIRARIDQRLEVLRRIEEGLAKPRAAFKRTPYFCAGCPHNTSTRVPDGSLALAGIGCHYMAIWMDRNTATFSQMGGEGAAWIGQAPFTERPHVFANLGDGTYNHSGILAIRAAVAAKVSITYKILFNDAVAMTGGQTHEGGLTPEAIAAQIAAEGVTPIYVISDEPEKYAERGVVFPPGTTVAHRDDLDQIQRTLRESPGVSALIYDQTCAAEKRRRRKRGLMPDPPERVFVNELVCEGCGDCGVQSNCVAIVPVETELGRKRAIDQSSCNKDYSCLKGFCPSFVTVSGGTVRKSRAGKGAPAEAFPDLPVPTLPSVEDEPFGILVTGVGGTGVVTIGALIGMAAHIEGKGCSVLDMTGLAQKGGAVISHVRIGARPEDIHAVRIAAGDARLLLGCDLVVAASPDALAKMRQGTTHAVVDSHEVMTGDFTRNPDLQLPGRELLQAIEDAAGPGHAHVLDATGLATGVLGDAIAANLFLLGVAWQKGLVPLQAESIDQAIEVNGVAVDFNRQAFLWGRRAAVDAAAVARAARPQAEAPAGEREIARTLDEAIERRVAFLTGYQDAAYAERYRRLVDRVRSVEAEKAPGGEALADAVARSYFKLLAIKDEYEVARLYTDGSFRRSLEAQFEGDVKLTYHLAPPILGERDETTGHLRKRAFGPWMIHLFRLLARMKGLRGTRLDVFGRTPERRMERRLIGAYEAVVEELLTGLTPDNHALAAEIARLPQRMRGFGHVKEANVQAAKAAEAELLARFRRPETPLPMAAE